VLAERMNEFRYERSKGSFQAWLRRLARDKIVDWLRRRARRSRETQALLSVADRRDGPDREWERSGAPSTCATHWQRSGARRTEPAARASICCSTTRSRRRDRRALGLEREPGLQSSFEPARALARRPAAPRRGRLKKPEIGRQRSETRSERQRSPSNGTNMLTKSLSSALVPILAAFALARPQVEPQPQPQPQPKIRNVAILVYPNVELLDFAGPGEVFSSTHYKDSHAFEVYTVAESREPLKSQGFVTITPQYTLDDCPKPDIVVVPGGNAPTQSLKLRKWVQARAQDTELMMSVCNGALVYGAAGLLDGLEATTHKSAQQSLALLSPTTKVLTNRRFVDNGHVLTSGRRVGRHRRRAVRGVATVWRGDRLANGALHGVRLAAG
jgi:putative intracellular protease/amidase/DNA-directed RNA polymerase specialized sigma24 family protein